MLKPGAALIEFGINRVSDINGQTRSVGDADFASCAEVAGWITPVPEGAGPVTVAILMKTAVQATALQLNQYRAAFASVA
jgi:methylenetetrahydrofolate dehydrogenase (NADP+)/methenyltetrahydrofolate cyclohydrolase